MLSMRIALVAILALSTVSIPLAAAPGPPQSLTAVITGNTVRLSWQAPSAGGLPATYSVEASLSPSGVVIASLPVAGLSLVVPNVPNGTYYLRVRAMNVDGVSDPSNEVIVLVPSGDGVCTSAPNPPQNLTSSVSGNLVTLTWSPTVGGCAPASYAVYAGSAPGLSNVAVLNVGAVTFLSAAAPSGNYYIRVVALNAFGGSAASNEVLTTVASACQLPSTAPILLAPTVSGRTVSLNWVRQGGPVTGYIVEAGSASGASNLLSTMTSATSYTWSNAPAGTHYIRVHPLNSCGTGPVSRQVTATVM